MSIMPRPAVGAVIRKHLESIEADKEHAAILAALRFESKDEGDQLGSHVVGLLQEDITEGLGLSRYSDLSISLTTSVEFMTRDECGSRIMKVAFQIAESSLTSKLGALVTVIKMQYDPRLALASNATGTHPHP